MAAIFTCLTLLIESLAKWGDHLCVKTLEKTDHRKIDRLKRAVFDDLHLWNGKRTLEKVLQTSLHTALVDSGLSGDYVAARE